MKFINTHRAHVLSRAARVVQITSHNFQLINKDNRRSAGKSCLLVEENLFAIRARTHMETSARRRRASNNRQFFQLNFSISKHLDVEAELTFPLFRWRFHHPLSRNIVQMMTSRAKTRWISQDLRTWNLSERARVEQVKWQRMEWSIRFAFCVWRKTRFCRE